MIKYVSIGRMCAFLSAIFVWIGGVLGILEMVGVFGTFTYNRKAWIDLDPTYLRTVWKFRRDHFGIQLGMDLVIAAAFFFFMGAAIVLSNLFKRFSGIADYKRLRKTMNIMFLLGAVIPAIEFVQNIGLQSTADSLSQRANVTGKDEDIIALEITYRMMESSFRWLVALDFIFLSAGVILCAHLSLKVKNTLSKGHAVLGYITGFIGLLTFILEVTSVGIHFSPLRWAYGIGSLLFNLILMPIWLIVVGFQLGRMARNAPTSREGEELVGQDRYDEDLENDAV